MRVTVSSCLHTIYCKGRDIIFFFSQH